MTHAMRRLMMLCEGAAEQRPDWLSGHWYHGTARRNLSFSPTAVAYFTPDRHEAESLARSDAEVDGGTPRVIQVKLNICNPVRIDTREMFDVDDMQTLGEGAATWHPTEREIGVFMYGGCAALALAIQKLTGLPLVALVEPDGETERAVHTMAKLADGRYLDVNGARTYDEILTDCRNEHECTTGGWSLVPASPRYLKLCIQDGIFDPIGPALAAEARKVAVRLVTAYGLDAKRTIGEGAAALPSMVAYSCPQT